MPTPFKFLSASEFESLNIEEKRAYLDRATTELERTKADHADGGWHRLFRDERQPHSKDDPEPQEPHPD